MRKGMVMHFQLSNQSQVKYLYNLNSSLFYSYWQLASVLTNFPCWNISLLLGKGSKLILVFKLLGSGKKVYNLVIITPLRKNIFLILVFKKFPQRFPTQINLLGPVHTMHFLALVKCFHVLLVVYYSRINFFFF